MKKIFLIAGIITVGAVIFVPSPPFKAISKELEKTDSLDYYKESVLNNINYIQHKVKESKEDLKFIQQNIQ